MSLKNLLDLRKKDIQIIERIIFKKRPFHKELFLTLAVIFTASGVIWGISKANDITSFVKPQTKNFSASGVVLNIDGSNLYIDQAKSSDGTGATSYVFNLLDNPKIETDQYTLLSVSDIQLGSKIIAQGKIDGGNITIKRIIYFGAVVPKELVATSTKEVATSTSTTTQQTSTEEASTAVGASTTDSDSKTNIVDTVKDTITDIVDSVSKDNSSTTNQVNIEESTSTSTTTSDTLLEKISDTIDSAGSAVKDTIDAIVEMIIPSATSTLPLNTDTTNTTDTPSLETASSTQTE